LPLTLTLFFIGAEQNRKSGATADLATNSAEVSNSGRVAGTPTFGGSPNPSRADGSVIAEAAIRRFRVRRARLDNPSNHLYPLGLPSFEQG
jgi:hypothetical protein